MIGNKLNIRRATVEDVPIIVELNQALFREDAGQRDPFVNLNWPQEEGFEYFSKLLANEQCLGLIAEIDSDEVGYLIGYRRPESNFRPVRLVELESMFVNEAFRSESIGSIMVQRFFTWAKDQGGQRVSVSAYAANERAIAFYKRFGFQPKTLTLEGPL